MVDRLCGVVLLLGLVVVGSAVATSSSSSLLVQSGFSHPSLYFRSSNKSDHVLVGPLGSDGSPTFWEIAQWNIPHDLPATPSGTSACHGGDALWAVSNPSARVCVHPSASSSSSGYTIELAQDGSQVPCGEEMDLFVSPTPRRDGPYPQNFANRSAPLQQLSSLVVTFDAQLVYQSVTPRCGKPPYCAAKSGEVDYGYSTLGVIFNNLVEGQTLFYQVNFHDTRGQACSGLNTCLPHRNWYFPNNPFGFTDHAGSYGAKCLRPGQPAQHYKLDVLPMVTAGIKSPPNGIAIDQNVSNWMAGGLYLGIGLQGSTVQTMLVSDFSLTQQLSQ